MKKLFCVLFVFISSCAFVGYDPQPESFYEIEEAKTNTQCSIVSAKPALYRCYMKEGAVCYVAQTGISCLPYTNLNNAVTHTSQKYLSP